MECIQTEVQTAICTRRTIDQSTLRRKGLADPNPLCASTRGRYLIIIIIHKTRKNRGGNCLLCLTVATPLGRVGRPWVGWGGVGLVCVVGAVHTIVRGVIFLGQILQ